MLQFFKYVLATIIGMMLFFFLMIFILIGIGSAMSPSDTVAVNDNSILKIDMNQQIVENSSEVDPFTEIFSNGVSQMGLVQLKESIANAKLDPHIKGISLKIEYPMAGMATLDEIRESLIDFKESGKFITAYGEMMSEPALYISSVADEIFINEAGGLEFNGLSSETTFLQGFFEKIGVKPVIFRVGTYKSAIEPFIRKDMSPASKEQVSSYLNDISQYFYGQIAQSRGIDMAKLNSILNEPKIHTPADAVEFGLITKTGYYDQYEALVKEKLGIANDKSINVITFNKYQKAKKYITEGDRNNRIAVIVGQGDIVSGETSGSNIASDSWIKELRKAVKDKKVKAIVLRINSGGGSAMASDIMWREIELAKKEKPVIASMGDYAASGGYYMAMGCDTIVANPTTITGSIGIFGMLFNAQELMNNKLGINFDGVETHEYADFPSLTRNMSDIEKSMIQNNVEQGYEKFTAKAAEGRKMGIDKLKSIASGRVWTGTQGKENGLVDVLGTLQDAIVIAAEKGGVDDYRVTYYPKPMTQLELIINKLENSSQMSFESYFGKLAPEMKQIKNLLEMDKLQARMPYEITIH